MTSPAFEAFEKQMRLFSSATLKPKNFITSADFLGVFFGKNKFLETRLLNICLQVRKSETCSQSATSKTPLWSQIPTEEEWSDDDSKCDRFFFNRFKTSEQNKYTDRLRRILLFSFLSVFQGFFCFFFSQRFLVQNLWSANRRWRVWQLKVQTAEREKPPSSSSSSSSGEQNICPL